jgi:carboxymethylenebutenolidase
VEYPGIIGAMQGYLATPAGGEVYPGILVVHDAIGLTEHIRDVARRFARVGYAALARCRRRCACSLP